MSPSNSSVGTTEDPIAQHIHQVHQSRRPGEQHDVSCEAILSMNIPFPCQILNLSKITHIPAPCRRRALKTVKPKASAKQRSAPAKPSASATKPRDSRKRPAQDAADPTGSEPTGRAETRKKKKAPKKSK